jgi:hypothetical protein
MCDHIWEHIRSNQSSYHNYDDITYWFEGRCLLCGLYDSHITGPLKMEPINGRYIIVRDGEAIPAASLIPYKGQAKLPEA